MKNRVSENAENMQWPTDNHLKYDFIGLFRFFPSFSISFMNAILPHTVDFCCRRLIFHFSPYCRYYSALRRPSVAVFIVATAGITTEQTREKRIYVIRKPWLLFHKCYYCLDWVRPGPCSATERPNDRTCPTCHPFQPMIQFHFHSPLLLLFSFRFSVIHVIVIARAACRFVVKAIFTTNFLNSTDTNKSSKKK